MEDEAKIYGLCLLRLKHQIEKAFQRKSAETGALLLECYNSGDAEEIVDILELYDLEDRSRKGLDAKLDELADTVSILTRAKLYFGYTEKGFLGLFIDLRNIPRHLSRAA
ncbi:MAG: hypothetical protein M0024_08020 [Nitrospiraceae bacterium]|nr:hypothetical protein [Nitrospiraceae bacterium]